jgi:hypothetical protein
MPRFRGAPWLLLAVACSSGQPSVRPPAPSPGGGAPAPGVDPIRNTPPTDAAISYPRAGGGVARYRLTRRDSLTAPMPTGEQQVQLVARTAFVTVAWIAADTGTRVSVAIDSVVGEGGASFVQAALDSARGTRWSGLRLPTGQFTTLSGAPRSQVGDQVRDEIQLLFPILPPEGARPGATWTASVTGPVRVSAFEASETAEIASQSSAPDPTGGLEIAVVRLRSASGEGQQFGQPITVRATGSDTLSYRIALDSRILSVTGVRSTALVIDLPSIGQTVPANERSAFQMTLIR